MITIDQGRLRRRCIVLLRRFVHHGPDDLACRDAAPLAGQFIAAARPPNPLENVGANQCLKQGFEITGRQVLTRRERLRRDRRRTGMQGDIDDGRDCEQTAPGQQHHLSDSPDQASPVDPKPPVPRAE